MILKELRPGDPIPDFKVPDAQMPYVFTNLTAYLEESRAPGFLPFVIEEEGHDIGFFALSGGSGAKEKYLPAGRVACVLLNFFIAPEHQRCGHASRALAKLPALAAARFPEATHLYLTVNVLNVPAQRVYLCGGFTDTGDIYSGGIRGPQHVFALRLDRSPRYAIVERRPTPDEYVVLRARSGVTPKSIEAARRGLEGSLYSVCAEAADGSVVGMGRIVGDGGCHYQVVDIVVLPEHQKKGLGRAILTKLSAWTRANIPETGTLSLLADGTAYQLYEKFGFRLSESRGMILRR